MNVQIIITVEIPEATQTQAREWAEFNTGYTNHLPADNVLMDTELEAKSCTVRVS